MITIKTKDEIAILREGGRRHAEILKDLASMLRPGLNIRELDDRANVLLDTKNTGDKSAFLNYHPYGADRPYPASLCVSINNEVVHGIPNETTKILKEGDIVSLDFGLIHKGLITDAAITVPVGKISREVADLLETTKKALMTAIKAAKGGKKTGDVGNAIERIGIAHGYGVVEELCGHGVGYSVHEQPDIPNYGDSGTGDLLRPGMVVAIEPIFNLGTRRIKFSRDGYTVNTADGKPSAHFEHTVVITKGEPEILTI